METGTSSTSKGTTQVSVIIKAPREAVYAACINPDDLAKWRVPDNMTAKVHEFDAREGGRYRMSLTYKDPKNSLGGKTSNDTDTFQGRFVELVPDKKIVEVVEFEAEDPGFAGEMTITSSFADVAEGTRVTMLCEGIPPGIRPEDNELGTRQSLQKLATMLEGKAF
jgi:uncharacterized protein YndB with AHSA1/START domain